MSQGELGVLVGKSQQAVQKWESGETKPRPTDLPALAEVLGVDAGLLLAEAGYMPHDKLEDEVVVTQRLPSGRTAVIRFLRVDQQLVDRLTEEEATEYVGERLPAGVTATLDPEPAPAIPAALSGKWGRLSQEDRDYVLGLVDRLLDEG